MRNYKLNKKQLQKRWVAHRAAKREDKATRADKIKTVYLLGRGWRIKDVMEALLMDEITVRNYYDKFKQYGIDGLLDRNYKGSTDFFKVLPMYKDELRKLMTEKFETLPAL